MLSASGDNVKVVGSVTKRSRYRKTRDSDVYNGERDESDQSVGGLQLRNRFKSVSTVTLKDHDSDESVKLFVYDEWAENLRALRVDDYVELEISPELLRDVRRETHASEYSYAVALHKDEDVTSPHFIRVRFNVTIIILSFPRLYFNNVLATFNRSCLGRATIMNSAGHLLQPLQTAHFRSKGGSNPMSAAMQIATLVNSANLLVTISAG